VVDGVVADKKVGRVRSGSNDVRHWRRRRNITGRLNPRATSYRFWCRSAWKQVRIGRVIRGRPKLIFRKLDEPSFNARMRAYLLGDEGGMDYPFCVDAVSDAERDEGQSRGGGDGENPVCMNNGRAFRHHHGARYCRNSSHRDMPHRVANRGLLEHRHEVALRFARQRVKRRSRAAKLPDGHAKLSRLVA
jgi:hypothetical protein